MEFEKLKIAYNAAMQMLMQQLDIVFSLQAELTTLKTELDELKKSIAKQAPKPNSQKETNTKLA